MLKTFRRSLVTMILLVLAQFAQAQSAPDVDCNYTIAVVMRLMNPVNVSAMNDGRQIATLLKTTDEYSEVSITCFPLLKPEVATDPAWRTHDASMTQFTQPGLTSNWDAKMQADLIADLKTDGIDVSTMDDKTLVQQVSNWLLHRSKNVDMFDTWFVQFVDGKPRIMPDLVEAAREPHNLGDPSWTFDQQFDHELLGRSMYSLKQHGSCTSYAIYQETALRALGIPTRIFMTEPIVDVNDESELDMVRRNVHHHQANATIMDGLNGTGQGFCNHTYNEVFVGGQWVPLNYNTLGQPMMDRNYMGLMIHVDTLSDWSDTPYANTWGKRYALGQRSDALPTSNPYRTLSITDSFGKNAHVDNPEATTSAPTSVEVSKVYWPSDPATPKMIADLKLSDPGTILLHVSTPGLTSNYHLLKEFLRQSGHEMTFKADGHPTVTAQITIGSVTSTPDVCEVFVKMPGDQLAQMDAGAEYTVSLPPDKDGFSWKTANALTLRKP